jgi:FkbM family methyltransferase
MFFFDEIFMPPLMTAVDVGAMLRSGDVDPFARLNKLGRLNVIGFEPQPAECEKLNALALPGRRYLPYAVGNGLPRSFYVTNTGMTSSLLRPNLRLAQLFNNLAELMQVVATPLVDTVRLDDVAEIRDQGCDLLKLDTQGSEAEILGHASEILKRCLIIQTEVEFVPLYEDQPLFADVDQLLRGRGFMFHRFLGVSGRTYKPLMLNDNPNAVISQMLWSDAVYVPDLARLDRLEPGALLKLAALLHEIYKSFDLCHVVLAAHDRQVGSSYAQRYFGRLADQQERADVDSYTLHSGERRKTAESTVLTLVDGVRIVVPNSIELITPYVLREQQDFFEDELRFVRGLLQPGQKVVDIGANYGVYTLPMALKVGPGGHVWAFEPASSTAQFLAQGIAANAFGHVTLEQKAVSSSSGSAQLSLEHDSELNSIIHGRPPAGNSETVSLVTLDECMDRYRWTSIELIKIDAEGEENNILKGGGRFFANLAPLVQYELKKDATNINLGLVREFAAIGYDSYRLVPGLNLLLPFDAESQPDPYLLNLFCCKAARADQLAARGVLLRAADLYGRGMNTGGSDAAARYHWSNALAHLPYATPLSSAWRGAEKAGSSTGVIQALSFYSRSRDAALSPPERFLALEASFLALKAECEREPVRLRLASLARVAHDYGARAVTVAALKQLLEYVRQAGVDVNEPFLPPPERFDTIAFSAQPVPWLIAAVLEQLEESEHYSTFYVGSTALGRLEDIHALGFGSPEMERRLELVRRRIDQARQPSRA